MEGVEPPRLSAVDFAYHYNFRYQLKLYICLTYLRFPYSIVCGLDYAFILIESPQHLSVQHVTLYFR